MTTSISARTPGRKTTFFAFQMIFQFLKLSSLCCDQFWYRGPVPHGYGLPGLVCLRLSVVEAFIQANESFLYHIGVLLLNDGVDTIEQLVRALNAYVHFRDAKTMLYIWSLDGKRIVTLSGRA